MVVVRYPKLKTGYHTYNTIAHFEEMADQVKKPGATLLSCGSCFFGIMLLITLMNTGVFDLPAFNSISKPEDKNLLEKKPS